LQRAYEGPRHPLREVATLYCDDKHLSFESIDGKRGTGFHHWTPFRGDVEVLPGTHTVVVVYSPVGADPDRRDDPEVAEFKFVAEAGHTYAIRRWPPKIFDNLPRKKGSRRAAETQ
jgi:hypothetical protein